MKLTVMKIIRKEIFCEDYSNLTNNNILDFTEKCISVIYGPNGTGKTSLAKVLDKEGGVQYSISIDGQEYTEIDDKIAHIINDQNGRNIIAGSTEDFILGDNIKREYELKEKIENGFTDLFNNKLIKEIRNAFGISTKTGPFYLFIKNSHIRKYVSYLANVKQKGRNIDRKEFLQTINDIHTIDVPDYDVKTFNYFVDDIKSKKSVIENFKNLQLDAIKQEPNLMKMEETEDAVRILEKYDYLDDCIVCDSTFERGKQLQKKKNQNKIVVESLSEQAKEIIEQIINQIGEYDPFGIKEKLKLALINGCNQELVNIRRLVKLYEDVYDALITNLFVESVKESGLSKIFEEYSQIILDKPEFEDEDVVFIENFLNECLGDRKIRLDRDENNNLTLLLGDKEFLECDRNLLQLSNGEQNFLSLSFELLKAKKIENEIIVLDDPISSFDSIYKNKIAYAIIKFLDKKKKIILTHNTDLIKLLEHQHRNCFNLYYMNNTMGEENGFIYINPEEIKLLLYTHEFLSLLRHDIKAEILDEKCYLISLVPFMRGYCQLINRMDLKNKLTKLMHGYENELVNITEIYNQLFSDQIIKQEYSLSAFDIINSNINHLKILKTENYPLLSKTLLHTYTYLYLRLNVEKKLVDKYGIKTQKYQMLSEIIIEAFKGQEKNQIRNRIFFLSRKTLLNEFNHFEMDMNIFQPAIDITNQALKKEKEEILAKLEEL